MSESTSQYIIRDITTNHLIFTFHDDNHPTDCIEAFYPTQLQLNTSTRILATTFAYPSGKCAMCISYFNLHASCDHWILLRKEVCHEAPKCCDEYIEVKTRGDCPTCADEIRKVLQLQIEQEMARAQKRMDAGYEADDDASQRR